MDVSHHQSLDMDSKYTETPRNIQIITMIIITMIVIIIITTATIIIIVTTTAKQLNHLLLFTPNIAIISENSNRSATNWSVCVTADRRFGINPEGIQD